LSLTAYEEEKLELPSKMRFTMGESNSSRN